MSDQQQKTKGVADIIFLIDATGSMQPCIDALKNTIRSFIKQLTTPDANSPIPVKDWRAAMVGFRDLQYDGADWLVDNPFSNQPADLENQLSALEARGGADAEESLLDALYSVSARVETGLGAAPEPMKWRHRHDARRVVVFFTDAPFRQPMQVKGAEGGGIADVIAQLMSKRIILFGFCPEWEGYETLAECDGAELEYVDSLSTLTADHKRFGELLLQLAKTISKSAAVPL